ncbi:hypothetical protein C2E23DRAFT_729604 [Lenzites betulinus]|nr:hypothetical protein C2E23DRAFT_729604 [Lenzites betulinus]
MVNTTFDYLHVDTLIRLRSTGPVADLYVSTYLFKKLLGVLRRFVENPYHFLDELEICCSVISGSSALSVLFRHSWTPDDLDVYTPRDYFWHVVAYLVNVENYTKFELLSHPDYNAYGTVRSVARLSRADGRRVDVVQSDSNSPLLPIASFWNTAVMNYIAPNSFCIAYPHLTDQLCAVTTAISPAEEDVSSATYPLVDPALLYKYEARGFAVRTDHLSWARTADPSAVCLGMDSPLCPLTMRYFGDRHCVTGSIPSVRGRRARRSLTKDFVKEYTAVWWKGGKTCGGECAKAGSWIYGSSYSCARTLFTPDSKC